ncbi:AraC family transcriptional regulator [Rubrolithibacter danxiaensis]|uniref:AraC family transcriptional regulator n=1 Tax=Rubrolithibacter danxiaensis TaxID=3390805 RepID=UPI003BF8A308
MKRYLQYEPININEFEVEAWEHPVHKHNHFEIIFIRKGEGKHFVNQNGFEYTSGDIFLLGPEDFHYFEITSATRFCYIRFMETIFESSSSRKANTWQRSFEFLLNAPYQYCGSIVKDDNEKKLLNNLLEVLLDEYQHRHSGSYEVMMDSLMKAILTILARNIIKGSYVEVEESKSFSIIENILVYIRQNIFQPEKLRIENLALNFRYSPKYLSIFFKKQTGENLQQYILKYKLKMVEYRLIYSDRSVSEIAYEFGFTDESHLYKIFKKYYEVNPSAYRMLNKRKEMKELV